MSAVVRNTDDYNVIREDDDISPELTELRRLGDSLCWAFPLTFQYHNTTSMFTSVRCQETFLQTDAHQRQTDHYSEYIKKENDIHRFTKLC